MNKMLLAAVAATAMISSAAFAAVTFDSSTGVGFVGKGDVQVPFGWNNKTLQNNATGVTFEYRSTDTYEAECEFFTGPDKNRTRHTNDVELVTGVSGSVDGDPRQGKSQFTGFNLKGFIGDPTVVGGTIPVVGEACKTGTGNSESQWLSVDKISSTGGLYAIHTPTNNSALIY